MALGEEEELTEAEADVKQLVQQGEEEYENRNKKMP